MSDKLYVAKTERANALDTYTDCQYIVANTLHEAAKCFPNADSISLLSKNVKVLKSE